MTNAVKPGKVYLVGAGPGDPGLLTLKGQRCLAEADLVLYDGLVNPLILRHTHALAGRTCRVGDGANRRLDQAEINRQLIAEALTGKTVVRLKGGDPFIFGRGSEEAAALRKAGIPFEVVPGVTAATGAGAYTGISLTHREFASAVAFITGHEDPTKPESALDYQELAKFPGTLVFYMGLHRIRNITAALLANGKAQSTPVAVISRASTPLQKTVTGTLENIAALVESSRLSAPSLIIVGECVSLRGQINWFEHLPLFGTAIGITRPEGHLDGAAEMAMDLGAHPVLMPTIEIRPIEDWTEVDHAIDHIQSYDWLIFTSVNGVDAFLNRIWDRGSDARVLAGVKLAAIGPATAERLRHHQLRADLVPTSYRGEALATALEPHVKGKRVLWARASRGREVIPQQLKAAGAQFESLVVYQHVDLESFPEDVLRQISEGELTWIALSSPTIAVNIARLLDYQQRSRVKFAAISPVTEAAGQAEGLLISAVAQEYTWQGIFDAIVAAHV
ncbi:uroporphyrinogen-III C-methyltransferase [Planctomicrobium sp. SH668]|uniref:uroporphyrinogen-III C-methyltransferase n=1 Tax=Planctomicrobium sp. SH668 TaxID=3448126 RepID=UPI003F5B0EE5